MAKALKNDLMHFRAEEHAGQKLMTKWLRSYRVKIVINLGWKMFIAMFRAEVPVGPDIHNPEELHYYSFSPYNNLRGKG